MQQLLEAFSVSPRFETVKLDLQRPKPPKQIAALCHGA